MTLDKRADWTLTRFRTPDGLTLVGDVGGSEDAPTIVLLHGGGQTRHSWAGAMQRFIDAGYRVANYDARGHGDSEWSETGDYSLPAFAADLVSVLASLRRPIALIGASLGGLTSFYALGSSDRPVADALVMVDVVLRPEKTGTDKVRQFMTAHHKGFETLEEASAAVAAYNPRRPRPSDPAGLRKNLRLRPDGRLYWHWDPLFIDQSVDDRTDLLLSVADRMTVPTLLVRGEHSDVVTDAGVAEMRSLVPQTEVRILAGTGHMIAGDRNDGFIQDVSDFLQRHLSAQSPA
jgi:non-heme chloroperoxidase